jgi:hypothetical protein
VLKGVIKYLGSVPRFLAETLYELLLGWIARDPVPDRPNRVEPRAIKRRPKEYDRLNRPRAEMRKTLVRK